MAWYDGCRVSGGLPLHTLVPLNIRTEGNLRMEGDILLPGVSTVSR